MKKYLILIFIGVMYSNLSYANLLQSLQHYCVPKDVAGCSADVKATFVGTANINYTSTNEYYCECPSDNMIYDKDLRVCKNCPAYTFAAKRTSTECWDLYCADTGDYPILLTGNDCPEGYEKILYETYLKEHPKN